MSIRRSVKNIFAIKETSRAKSLKALLNQLEAKKEELTLINFHINKGRKLLAAI